MSHELKGLQNELYRLMSDISETCYCAGWMSGNEHRLWDAITKSDDDLRYGLSEITRDEVDRLRQLSEIVGGWIVWWDEHDEPNLPPQAWGPRFMPRDEWVKRHAGPA